MRCIHYLNSKALVVVANVNPFHGKPICGFNTYGCLDGFSRVHICKTHYDIIQLQI